MQTLEEFLAEEFDGPNGSRTLGMEINQSDAGHRCFLVYQKFFDFEFGRMPVLQEFDNSAGFDVIGLAAQGTRANDNYITILVMTDEQKCILDYVVVNHVMR